MANLNIKKLLILFNLIWVAASVHAQIESPVKWDYSSEKVNDQEYNLVFKVDIQEGWHVYSQFIEEGGPVPTLFAFIPSPDYELIGKVTESPEAVSAFDNNFEMQISWHEKEVVFKQRVKLNKTTIVKGAVEYMACTNDKCLPPVEEEFSISVNKKQSGAAASSTGISKSSEAAEVVGSNEVKGTGGTSEMSNSEEGQDSKSGSSYWLIFIAGFLGGLAAFFMPCIYPMIPLTVSFFTKKEVSRKKGIQNAIIYGLSIIAIYVGLGLVITASFGASALNEAASSATFNLIFFVVLVIFALSFLGAFEITLPSSFVNKMDQKSDKGGLVGLFFMAFSLALVSFSCTGPIIGTLLVESVSKGSYLGPAIGMLGFASALAIPFTLFAIFPAWLKEMPKSGGWLNSVKVSLGFLELALAFKFLSNVDLAYHWGILNRDVFLVIWIIIFAFWGFYLIGKIKFSHDAPLPSLSLPRLFFAMLVFGFTLYMIPGMWGSPLKAISAWLPPQTAQDFDVRSTVSRDKSEETAGKKYASLFHAPHGLDAFYDYNQGLEHAEKVNKPVLVDFTGWSCTNCRKMEASVWSDPVVLELIKNDYVLISLYVDDKTELDEGEKYVSRFNDKKIKTLGQKWSDLQASTFSTNSQPYYVVLNSGGSKLIPSQAFNLDIENYVRFLKSGKEAFQVIELKKAGNSQVEKLKG